MRLIFKTGNCIKLPFVLTSVMVIFSCKTMENKSQVIDNEGRRYSFVTQDKKAIFSLRDNTTSKKVVQDTKALARKNPRNFEILRDAAETLLSQGDLKGAEDHAKKALDLNFRDIRSKIVLAHVAYLMGNDLRSEAILYNIASLKGADTTEALNLLGCLLLNQEKSAEAMTAFMKALEKNPDNVAAMANIGILHLKRYEPQLAEKQFKSALNKVPGHPDVLTHLGVALAMQGKLAEAKEAYNNVPSLYQEKPLYIYNVAVLKMKLGDAEASYRDLLQMKKKGQDVLISAHAFQGLERELRARLAVSRSKVSDADLDSMVSSSNKRHRREVSSQPFVMTGSVGAIQN